MKSDTNIQQFWKGYLSKLPKNHVHRFLVPKTCSLGNSAEMANKLGTLVVRGIKSATCSRYLGDNILNDAGLSIILDGKQNPLCLIEIYEITVRRYCEIDEEWAASEGEGDRSLDYWRNAHWKFFSQEAEIVGYELSEAMLLSCERFRVLY
jgi:uncharacterized protein YhfF